MRILVVLGHPRLRSFGAAIAEEFAAGARAAGAAVRQIAVAELEFDPDVHTPDPCEQELEPDLQSAQESIRWADHLVFVYPTYWGGMPARLKGFLDRTFTPGFAFQYFHDGAVRRKLLRGKTAEIITTIDMPPEAYRARYRQPGVEALRRAVFRFCGVQTTRVSLIGPVAGSALETRAAWLREQYHAGERRAHGARSGLQRSAVTAARLAVRHRVSLYIAAVAALPLLQYLLRIAEGTAHHIPSLLVQFLEAPAALLGWAPALIMASELKSSRPAAEPRRSEDRYRAAIGTGVAAVLWVFGLQLFLYGLEQQVWFLLIMLAAGKSLLNELSFRRRRPESWHEPERAVGIALVFGASCMLPPLVAQVSLWG